MPLVRGIVDWARVHQVDRNFVKIKLKDGTEVEKASGGEWYIHLRVDPENEKILLDSGLGHLIKYDKKNVRNIKIPRNEINFTTKKPNSPPKVVDSLNQPMTELIGNGSMVQVSFTVAEKEKAGFKKKYPTLQAIMVETLVPYASKNTGSSRSDFKPVVNGYVTPKPVVAEESAPEASTDDADEPPFEADTAKM